MTKILLAPNPTGTGHNMRILTLSKQLKALDKSLEMVVLLGSRQDVFTSLFEKEKIAVIDIEPRGVVDYSKDSHLSKFLDWESMISNYFVPTFFNGDKILKYLIFIREQKASLLISDYNINASIAASICGIKSVFVTERHNFTLVDVSVEDLEAGGFEVRRPEIESVQKELNILFRWLIENTDLIITDKLFLDSFRSDRALKKLRHKVHFTGSIYTEREASEKLDFEQLKIDLENPYIIGTVSSTTMFSEDKKKNLDFYRDTFKELKKEIPKLQLVLLGTSSTPERRNDVINLPYLPNWRELLERSSLLISHPGWITVTEVAYLDIPTVFYLSSYMEYHELEAYKRLKETGLPVFEGYNVSEFCSLLQSVLKHGFNFEKSYKLLNPNQNGAEKATKLIYDLIVEDR